MSFCCCIHRIEPNVTKELGEWDIEKTCTCQNENELSIIILKGFNLMV